MTVLNDASAAASAEFAGRGSQETIAVLSEFFNGPIAVLSEVFNLTTNSVFNEFFYDIIAAWSECLSTALYRSIE